MGIRKLPVIPVSTDYLGAASLGISMPGIFSTMETSPLIPFRSLRNPRAVSQSPNLHGPDDATHHLSFSMFVSTGSGQPR